MRVQGSALAFLAMLAWHPAASCEPKRQAEIPITEAGGLMLVPVALNGTTVDFVLDTGAERSVVGVQAAERLGLARDAWVSTDMQGAGGRDRRRLGRPVTLSLGGVALRRRTVAQDNSVVVGPIPEQVDGRPIAGLLGQDYLSAFDLELDAGAGRVTLYGMAGCGAGFVPWGGHALGLGASRPVRTMLAVPVRVAGQAMLAELDTGASASVILAPGMARLGLAGGGRDQVQGFGPGGAVARRQTMVLQVGPLPAAPAALLVTRLWGLRSIGMLLGADWAGAHRLWISWTANEVFVPR